MSEKKLKTLKYMKAFQCIGPACEDNCCGGWYINLEQADVERLQLLRPKSALVDELFDVAVQPHPDSPASICGILSLNHQSRCHFEQEGLCGIHRDFGDSVLPKACATYPRMVVRQGENYELSGKLSCPEVARLCLLDEGAMALEDSSWSLLPERIGLVEDHSSREAMGLAQSFRDLVLVLLGEDARPLEHSIYLVAYAGRKLDALAKGQDLFQGRLKSLIQKLMDPSYQAKILAGLGRNTDPHLAHQLVLCVLEARKNHSNSGRYNTFVAQLLAGFAINSNQLAEHVELERFWRCYLERKQALLQRFGARIERYLRNYALNVFRQESWARGDTVSALVRELVLSYAVVKFMLIGHPEQAQLALLEQVGDEDMRQLERNAVEAVQVFSKNISHNAAMLSYLSDSMKNHGLMDVSDLYALLII